MFEPSLTVHLHIRKNWLAVRAIPRQGDAVQVEGVACVAVRHSDKGKSEIIAISEEAVAFTDVQNVVIHNAFCHPRVLIGGFDDAELVVREFLRIACGGKKRLLRFRMVIYLPDGLEGGLTDVEERALKELGLRLGANDTTVESEQNKTQNMTLA